MKSIFLLFSVSLVLFLLLWSQWIYALRADVFSVRSLQFMLIPVIMGVLAYLSNWIVSKVIKLDSNIVVRNFLAASLLGLLLSATSKTLSTSTLDLQLHDTYFIIEYSYILNVFALTMGIFAILYWAIPKMRKNNLNEKLGLIHFWLSVLGILFLIGQTYIVGRSGVASRNYSFEPIENLGHLVSTSLVMALVAILVIVAQLLFVLNVLLLIVRQYKPKGD